MPLQFVFQTIRVRGDKSPFRRLRSSSPASYEFLVPTLAKIREIFSWSQEFAFHPARWETFSGDIQAPFPLYRVGDPAFRPASGFLVFFLSPKVPPSVRSPRKNIAIFPCPTVPASNYLGLFPHLIK